MKFTGVYVITKWSTTYKSETLQNTILHEIVLFHCARKEPACKRRLCESGYVRITEYSQTIAGKQSPWEGYSIHFDDKHANFQPWGEPNDRYSFRKSHPTEPPPAPVPPLTPTLASAHAPVYFPARPSSSPCPCPASKNRGPTENTYTEILAVLVHLLVTPLLAIHGV